jgi:hypothetical protein
MQTDADRIKELEQLLKIEKSKSNKYEENGVAKLYYSLNRKAWEMADLMNGKNLKDLDIADPKDKTFDRLKIIWQDAASIATSVKTLGETAGITGDEAKDLKMNRNITPENISDVLGNPAGQRS